MAERFVVDCPAKINLYLRVGAPEPGGYHPIETEFQAISLCDTLELDVGGEGIEIFGMDLPGENTLSRAVRLMQEVANLPRFGLRLTKRIPAQAGLGGGSSDAAGLLRALRKVLPLPVPDRDFATVARSVGADVPFFLVGGRAAGTGHGEVLTALPDVEARWLVVAKPEVGCLTSAMYRSLDERRESGRPASTRAGLIENDFHAVAPPECMAMIEQMVGLGLGPAGLSGSGSAVFGFAESEAAANTAAATLPGALAVRTLTRAESHNIERIRG